MRDSKIPAVWRVFFCPDIGNLNKSSANIRWQTATLLIPVPCWSIKMLKKGKKRLAKLRSIEDMVCL